MTRDCLTAMIAATVPCLQTGDVNVLVDHRSARILIAIRRAESALGDLRAALRDHVSPCFAVEVRTVTDGGSVALAAPPVPLVYAPDIIASTRWDSDDEGARDLAHMTREERAGFYMWNAAKVKQ